MGGWMGGCDGSGVVGWFVVRLAGDCLAAVLVALLSLVSVFVYLCVGILIGWFDCWLCLDDCLIGRSFRWYGS